MLYREIIAVCSQIHTKHTNTLCEQNAELLNVKHGGKYITTGRWRTNISRNYDQSASLTHSVQSGVTINIAMHQQQSHQHARNFNAVTWYTRQSVGTLEHSRASRNRSVFMTTVVFCSQVIEPIDRYLTKSLIRERSSVFVCPKWNKLTAST
jgi:hypothetical protein